MDVSWGEYAMRAVEEIAATKADMTGDDVWFWLERHDIPGPSEPRALGVVMIRAAKRGLIVKTPNFRDSERPGMHRTPLRVWNSCGFVVAGVVDKEP